MELTPATTADIVSIVDCWIELATDQRRFGAHLQTETNRTRIRESVARRVIADEIVLARTSEEIAGFTMYTIEQGQYETDVVRGLVDMLYVRPHYRNDGLGSRLLSCAERLLSKRGAKVVSLEVMAENADARRLYQRRGYEPHRLELEKTLE